MADLPLIDAQVTSDQISVFITKYTQNEEDKALLEKEPMNLSFSSTSEGK